MVKTAAGEACFERVVHPRLSIGSFWMTLRRRVAKSRCRLVHRTISRPVHGKYRCWTCLQEFDTDW
jgi:hypothetical protein